MNKLIINGCTLQLTCRACPEQYDVYFDDFQIGYLRLRHGNFTASYTDYGGDLVYKASPFGDGVFEDAERMFHLTNAVDALTSHHNNVTLDKLYKAY